MRMTFSIPAEFTDEDKWFRFFYKKNLAVFCAGAAFTYLLWKVLDLGGLGIAGLIAGGMVTTAITAVTMLPIPESSYLKGGGQTLDIILIRRLIRRKSAVIYIRGYGRDGDE